MTPDITGPLFVTLLTIAFTYYILLAFFGQEVRDIKRYISNLEFHLVAPPKTPTPVVVEEIKVQGFPTGPGVKKSGNPIVEGTYFVAGCAMLAYGWVWILGGIVSIMSTIGVICAIGVTAMASFSMIVMLIMCFCAILAIPFAFLVR